MKRVTYAVLSGLTFALVAGCGGGGLKEETITVPKQDPMNRAKIILQNYANGNPLSSEVESYPEVVAEVEAVDPAKAAILKAGFDEIKKNPNQAKAKAKELLGKLGLDEKK